MNSLLFLAFIPALWTSAQDTFTDNLNCTKFTWDDQPFQSVLLNGERVSPGINCPRDNTTPQTGTNITGGNFTTGCPLVSQGDGRFILQFNVTVHHTYTKQFFDMVNSTVYDRLQNGYLGETKAERRFNRLKWDTDVIGPIDHIDAVPPGMSAYVEFQPWGRCVTGELSNCTDTEGKLHEDEKPGIKLCAPVYFEVGERRIPAGQYKLVEFDPDEIDIWSHDPFARQARSKATRRDFVDLKVLGLALCGLAWFLIDVV